jgi:hypothetical protein
VTGRRELQIYSSPKSWNSGEFVSALFANLMCGVSNKAAVRTQRPVIRHV